MTCSKPLLIVLTVILLLLVFSPSSNACSCIYVRWAPHLLCCRDIVIHGEVQGDRLVGINDSYMHQNQRRHYSYKMRVYTIHVKEIFKGLERIKNISKDHNTSYVEIYTGVNDGDCGITLEQQQSYVVTGSAFQESKTPIKSELCHDWQSKWETVPASYKEFFPKLKTCKCSADANYAGRFFFMLSMLLTVWNIK